MKKINLPFAPWEPDKPDFSGEYSLRARNVIPAATGFRPFPSMVKNGSALAGKVLGAAFFVETSGLPTTIAGTQDRLFFRGASNWLGKGSGYNAGNNGWSFALFGDIIVATNGVDDPRCATLGPDSLTSFTVLAGAPKANTAAVVGDFLMLGGLSAQPNAVRWSGIDDPFAWPEPGSNDAQYKQSDIQVFPDGGNVQAIATGMTSFDALIFCERAIKRAQYIGPPYVFQFSDVTTAKGTIAPRSVVQAGNLTFFLAEEGFFVTDGSTVTNIGLERIDLWWRQNSNDQRRYEVQGVYDPINGVVVWRFASNSCPDGITDRLLLFHPELNRFSLVFQEMECLCIDSGRGITLEQLDELGALDSLPMSLDAKSLKGGVPMLGAFNEKHNACLFSGLPMPAVIETMETGGQRMMIMAARPLIDGANADCTVLYRDFQSQAVKSKSIARPSTFDGLCRCHISARYARLQVDIPGQTIWTHATGAEFYLEEDGGM